MNDIEYLQDSDLQCDEEEPITIRIPRVDQEAETVRNPPTL